MNIIKATENSHAEENSHASQVTNRSRVRRRVLMIVVVMMGLILARLLLVDGWLRPVRIAGGSMAETFVGGHFDIRCEDCGFRFRCGLDSPPPLQLAVCPNCGYRGNDVGQAIRRPGERVLLDRLAYWFRSPSRWEAVAFKQPDHPSQWSIKRVVGLPGEQVAIRRGDLFINGQRLCKPLHAQRELAVLVHDAAFEPQDPTQSRRWLPERQNSGWSYTEGRFLFQPRTASETTAKQPDLDWMSYRHWNCFASATPRAQESPVRDNDPYNQGSSRELKEVSDLIVRASIRAEGQGRLVLSVLTGFERVECQIDPAESLLRIRVDDQPAGSVPLSMSAQALALELMTCDRQVRLVLDGVEQLQVSLPSVDRPFQPSVRPVAWGAWGGPWQLAEVRLLRDVYYLGAADRSEAWAANRLHGDEYFVLGDNPAISYDSRSWKHPGLARKLLLGRVLRFPD